MIVKIRGFQLTKIYGQPRLMLALGRFLHWLQFPLLSQQMLKLIAIKHDD